jgi:hypothetical protein
MSSHVAVSLVSIFCLAFSCTLSSFVSGCCLASLVAGVDDLFRFFFPRFVTFGFAGMFFLEGCIAVAAKIMTTVIAIAKYAR